MFVEADGAKRPAFFKDLFDRFRGAVARWDEMQGLDFRELESIARELNLSKAELRALAFRPARSLQSLSTRLSHAGLSERDLAAAHGDVLRDMRRVCGQCKSRARCARDLKRERRATPSKCCPNERTLRSLADEAHRSFSRILPFPAARN